ncbi:MAG: DUF1127 domain-containing protein [Burkholderiales bacterium]
MDGSIGIHGSRQRARTGYARIDIVIELALAGAAALGRGLSALIRAQHRARLRREMLSLSDHYLRDIGLSRHEIDQIFR